MPEFKRLKSYLWPKCVDVNSLKKNSNSRIPSSSQIIPQWNLLNTAEEIQKKNIIKNIYDTMLYICYHTSFKVQVTCSQRELKKLIHSSFASKPLFFLKYVQHLINMKYWRAWSASITQTKWPKPWPNIQQLNGNRTWLYLM